MRRYKGQEIIDTTSDDAFASGDYYLLERCPEQGSDRFELHSEPGRTNQSGEERTEGWLGTTNNVARYARGCVRVSRDAAGRVRIKPIDPAVMAAAEETSDA